MISYITRYTDLSGKKFLLHPHPQKNELLSSWLVRVALAHQTMPWSFMNMHFPEYKNIVFSRDVDIWAPDQFIDKLAWKSRLNSKDIFNMTLRSYEGYLLERIRVNGPNFFISSIIPRKRRNVGYGQKYCPQCLAEYPVYFRKEWRLSFYSVCLEHNCRMVDRCQYCRIPIAFYKFKRENGFDRCYNCGKLLSKGDRGNVASNEELACVKRLIKILQDGYIVIDEKPIYSMAFFEGFHQISKIVKRFYICESNSCNSLLKTEEIIFNLECGLKELLVHPKIYLSHLSQDMQTIPSFYYAYLRAHL